MKNCLSIGVRCTAAMPKRRTALAALPGTPNSRVSPSVASATMKLSSPRQFYEDVGIPVLRMATVDHRLQEASAEHRHRIVSGMSAVIDELRVRHAAERHLRQ